MQVTHENVPILDMLNEGRPTAVVVPRDTSERWLVRELPVGVDQHGNKTPWSWTVTGDFIRIPLFPYQGSDQPPSLMAFAFKLGFEAARQAVDVQVERLHLVVGAPLEALVANGAITGYRWWLGFALLSAR